MTAPVSAPAQGRYSRQELFAGIGPLGQAKIRTARVVVVGWGASDRPWPR
jgi:molybdopterin/thiamine biosynthesis adenylyltransferase